jgi:ArsR family metal-binding transcriptional regulator
MLVMVFHPKKVKLLLENQNSSSKIVTHRLIHNCSEKANMLDGLENVIVSLYAKGMSNSDIEEQIRVYNFDVSTQYYLSNYR